MLLYPPEEWWWLGLTYWVAYITIDYRPWRCFAIRSNWDFPLRRSSRPKLLMQHVQKTYPTSLIMPLANAKRERNPGATLTPADGCLRTDFLWIARIPKYPQIILYWIVMDSMESYEIFNQQMFWTLLTFCYQCCRKSKLKLLCDMCPQTALQEWWHIHSPKRQRTTRSTSTLVMPI
jgi:hypothetical protein